MEGFLRYGASIYLFNTFGQTEDVDSADEADKEAKPADKQTAQLRGFISCKGFLNRNVYFQTLEGAQADPSQMTPNISNLRDFVFTVTPRLKSEFHRDYRNALKEFKTLMQSYKLLTSDEKKEKKRFLE
jgi:hypothetical protein